MCLLMGEMEKHAVTLPTSPTFPLLSGFLVAYPVAKSLRPRSPNRGGERRHHPSSLLTPRYENGDLRGQATWHGGVRPPAVGSLRRVWKPTGAVRWRLPMWENVCAIRERKNETRWTYFWTIYQTEMTWALAVTYKYRQTALRHTGCKYHTCLMASKGFLRSRLIQPLGSRSLPRSQRWMCPSVRHESRIRCWLSST